MIPKIRDISIAVAILALAAVYVVSAFQRYSYDKRFDNARIKCARQNKNYQNKDAYASCMIYAGFDNNVNFNYGQNQNTNYDSDF